MIVRQHVEGGRRLGQDLWNSQLRMVDRAVGNLPSLNPAGKLHAMLVIPSTAYGVPGANGALAPSA